METVKNRELKGTGFSPYRNTAQEMQALQAAEKGPIFGRSCPWGTRS
jgi:hypothetical protein